MSASTTVLPRTGPAIRAALVETSPTECALFEQEFAAAAAEASQTIDETPLKAVLDHWWRIAAVRTNPLTEDELAMIGRARAGDLTGWRPGPDGL